MFNKRNPHGPAVKRIALTLIGLTVVFAGYITSAQVRNESLPSIKNFGRINSNYFRGSQPDHETVARLKAFGIKTVIDLRKDNKAEESEWVGEEGMKYINIPLKASRPATDEQVSYFLSLVNDPENWPVYVHCKGGRHRTGALTGIYRITHDGWTADQAWQEMKDYDFDNGIFGGPGAQKKFVYNFYEHSRESVEGLSR